MQIRWGLLILLVLFQKNSNFGYRVVDYSCTAPETHDEYLFLKRAFEKCRTLCTTLVARSRLLYQ